MDDLTNPNPDGGAAATLETEPAAAAGTVQPGGEANGQGASVEETFGNVDPKTLPPQLKAVYDNMLRGFKEKTTKVSETVKSEVAKATESFKQKAELYDQLSQQEEFVKMWNEHVQKAQQAQTQNQDPTAELKAKLQQMEVKIHQREASEIIDAFSGAVDEKGQPLHPDFDKFNQLVVGTHEQAGEYSLLRTAIELAPGKDHQEKLENGYKQVKALYDSIFEEGKKAGLGRVQAKARNGSLSPSSVNAGATAPRAPKNAMEALQFARQGLLPAK